MSRRWRRAFGNLGLFLGSVAFFLGVVEVGLRLVGFSYVLYPEEIEFGKPEPELLKEAFREDDELFWVTRDYPQKLRRLAAERPEIVFMGDSCTQFGSYDRELARLVEERRGRELRYGNLGVAGWTTFQGRRQLARDVVALTPRVVTIYYGWNDHWMGFGVDDATVARIKGVFSSRWSRLRVVQLATKAVVALGAHRAAWPNRVSLAAFRANLRAMVGEARAAGVRPLLLTAPTSIREGAEPEYLAARWARDLSEVVPLHRAYAEAVREVAASAGAALCDLERSFAALPRVELDAAMMADGIHLTEEGSRRLADVLFACLEREGLLAPLE
ncbi:MAG TPA: GDSL-type esterase/lipase family protein [Thermoanaerobaculia bacterium]